MFTTYLRALAKSLNKSHEVPFPSRLEQNKRSIASGNFAPPDLTSLHGEMFREKSLSIDYFYT
jgi:hypothetical protein